ncbi:hypothetical protein GIB67_042669 [Kingdonia uniflora]|uniref:Uncharacterized protein n=1 Tax=Kingdonia uniflora TaxID=39325 RepID=A0A7J7P261_9MAGN|nr:hypothetical protein GIB67_042669 [Kingdonia uniflora]
MKYTGGLVESIRKEFKLFFVTNIKDAIVKAIAIKGKYLKSDKKTTRSSWGTSLVGKTSIRERPREGGLRPRSIIVIIVRQVGIFLNIIGNLTRRLGRRRRRARKRDIN